MINNGALNFTLGMQANQFLNALGIASGKLLGFTGIASALNTALHKMWAAIEKGGQLKDLAAAASLSVKDLYQLQRAFKEVGASADSVPSAINRLRRTLAGGEADGVLASMGLDPSALAKMNPAKQFELIAAAMAKLNVNARSQAATKIFGREGAQTMQQIANSGNEFADAMKEASEDATIWDKVANSFDAISDKVAAVQDHINTMWALLAGALVQAFQEGHLVETLFDIFSSVFKALGAALPGLLAGGFVKLGELLLNILTVPLTYVQTLIDFSIQKQLEGISKVMAMLGMDPGFEGDSWATLLANNKSNGLDFFGASTKDMSDFAAGQITGGLAAGKAVLEGLGSRLGELISRLPQSQMVAAMGGGAGIGGAGKRPDMTSLEKIGLVIGGRGSSIGDYSKETAVNTRQTVAKLTEVVKVLSNVTGANFLHQ